MKYKLELDIEEIVLNSINEMVFQNEIITNEVQRFLTDRVEYIIGLLNEEIIKKKAKEYLSDIILNEILDYLNGGNENEN